MVTINRDPFARTELERNTVPAPQAILLGTCKWCGQLNKAGGLFQYRLVEDGGRHGNWSAGFCSVNCYRTFTS